MYKVIGSSGSRMTRVLWMLEELGQLYKVIQAKPQSPEARQYNATGKVPILLNGDFALCDSAAICVYLGEKHPEGGMASRTLEERAQMDSWLHFAQSELEAPLWNKLKHRFIIADELKAEVGPWTEWEFARHVKALARRLDGNQYALGDRFTAVDVVIGHTGSWARNAKFDIEPDVVNAYLDRILARPALARARKREAA